MQQNNSTESHFTVKIVYATTSNILLSKILRITAKFDLKFIFFFFKWLVSEQLYLNLYHSYGPLNDAREWKNMMKSCKMSITRFRWYQQHGYQLSVPYIFLAGVLIEMNLSDDRLKICHLIRIYRKVSWALLLPNYPQGTIPKLIWRR